ncbi:MAG: hypothetical protein L0Y55_10490, partial [Anaerolineales bacterium]|nr:hypothetical protein [Anaerolineales bacterium]
FHQDVAAFVPVTVSKYSNFNPDVAILDNGSLSTNVEALYAVSRPESFWDRVLFEVPRHSAFGVSFPLGLKQVEEFLKGHVQLLIEQTVILVTNDPSVPDSTSSRALKEKIIERLKENAVVDGIEFQTVDFKILISYLEEP